MNLYQQDLAAHGQEDAQWYQNQHDTIQQWADHVGTDPTKFAGEVAATSPQTKWDYSGASEEATGGEHPYPNLEHAAFASQIGQAFPNTPPDDLVQSLDNKTTMFSQQFRAAVNIEQADNTQQALQDNLHGPKVVSFYNNLAFPGQTNDITVDGWMAKVVANAGGSTGDVLGSNNQGYGWTADMIRQAAQDAGITDPNQASSFQAAVWQYSRETAGGIKGTGKGT